MADTEQKATSGVTVKPWAWVVGYIVGGAIVLSLVASLIGLPFLIWSNVNAS